MTAGARALHRMWRLLLPLATILGIAALARAQDGPAMEVTARLQAPVQVLVGSTLRLELQVMTPTWFTQPPQLPALDLPGVMVTPPSGQGEIVREQKNGVAYSGLRYTYVLSPTTSGTLQVPALAVSAQVGPGNHPVSASSDPLSFTVAAGSPSPVGAAAIAAGQLQISQEFALAPDPLVQGGRVTRSIVQRADDVQAMLLPAAPLADVPGFKRYPREPEVTTLTDGRGGFRGGQRIDRADYVALDSGKLALPAITLSWRDAASGQARQQELPGREFTVPAAPAAAPVFSLADDLARLRHDLRWVLPASWLAWTAGLGGAVLLVWLGRPWWRRAAGYLRQRFAQARARRRASEAWHWRAWRRAARPGRASLREFYQWLRLAANAGDLRSAVAPLGESDRVLAERALQQAYGRRREGAAWQVALVEASRGWRRAWRVRRPSPDAHALPEVLNSPQAYGLAAWPSRPEKGAR